MIALIRIGVGVDIDKSFSTKWLVDHLQIKLFKQTATKESRHIQPPEVHRMEFTQWVC